MIGRAGVGAGTRYCGPTLQPLQHRLHKMAALVSGCNANTSCLSETLPVIHHHLLISSCLLGSSNARPHALMRTKHSCDTSDIDVFLWIVTGHERPRYRRTNYWTTSKSFPHLCVFMRMPAAAWGVPSGRRVLKRRARTLWGVWGRVLGALGGGLPTQMIQINSSAAIPTGTLPETGPHVHSGLLNSWFNLVLLPNGLRSSVRNLLMEPEENRRFSVRAPSQNFGDICAVGLLFINKQINW